MSDIQHKSEGRISPRTRSRAEGVGKGGYPRGVYWEIAQHVASTSTATPVISRLSLGFERSDLSADELKDMMKALGVSGGWDAMLAITQRAGLSGITPFQVFVDITKRRHQAAHDGTAQVLLADLSDAADHVLAVALAYRVVLDRGLPIRCWWQSNNH